MIKPDESKRCCSSARHRATQIGRAWTLVRTSPTKTINKLPVMIMIIATFGVIFLGFAIERLVQFLIPGSLLTEFVLYFLLALLCLYIGLEFLPELLEVPATPATLPVSSLLITPPSAKNKQSVGAAYSPSPAPLVVSPPSTHISIANPSSNGSFTYPFTRTPGFSIQTAGLNINAFTPPREQR